jgi:hypothetical protein
MPLPLAASRYANAFMEIGVGAKALSMGGAACSFTNDGTSFFWNPAGLAFVKRMQISGMVGNQFGSLTEPLGNYHFLGLTLPMSDKAVISANWIRLAVDGIPVYAELEGRSYFDRLHNPALRPSGEQEGSINDIEDGLVFSFARNNLWNWDLGWMYHRVKVEIPFGINLKFIRQSIGSGSAFGIGMDAGAMIKLHLSDLFQEDHLGPLAFGITLQDLTRTSMNWNTKHQDPIPVNVKWGLSYIQPLPIENNFLSIVYDRDSRWGGRGHAGIEYAGFRVFSLRAGFDDRHFTAGAGIRFWSFAFDYAFLSHELDVLHRIGCSISF